MGAGRQGQQMKGLCGAVLGLKGQGLAGRLGRHVLLTVLRSA